MRFLKVLISIVILLVILGGAGIGAAYVWYQNDVAKAGPLVADTSFTVKPGEGLASVANRLESEGMIRDTTSLRLKARFDGTETAIKTGQYTLPARASSADILELLVSGDVIQHKITLPEGRTTAQLLKIISEDPLLTGDMPDEIPAEGSLLPDTYLFDTGTSRIELINRLQDAQEQLLETLWPNRKSDDSIIATRQDAIILASVVEKETAVADERPLIAGLFTTRLKRGMRLQSDPTIIYGITKGEPLYNRKGQRRTLYRSEIDTATDWNTYQMDGLPKTPICNPGRDAIAAVLDPPETEYLFFVADGKGGHLFAMTNAEHEANVRAYRAYEAAEIARERADQ